MANKSPVNRGHTDPWTADQIAVLTKLYPKTHNEIIAGELGKSERSIRAKATLLKIKKASYFWDRPEETFVLKNWDAMSPDEISKGLKEKFGMDKTKWSVINKYRELKGL